jgi:hypothetical protein
MPLLLFLLLSFSAHAEKVIYDDHAGSCEDFNLDVKNRGLKDTDGNTHISTLGWTVCHFKAPPPKDGLPILKRKGDGRMCLKADLGKVRFEEEHSVIVMRWDHSRFNVTDACKSELARNERVVIEHESHHVADCQNLVTEANKAWAETKHEPEACEPIKVQGKHKLRRMLRAKIGEALAEQLQKMSHNMEYRSKETHERIGYGTSGIDCGKCGE